MIHERLGAIILAADPLPTDVQPNANDLPHSEALKTILGWTLYGALFACGIAAVASGGFAAWGRVTARPQQFDRGFSTFLTSVACGFLVGIAIPLVNTFYGLAT